MTKKALTSLLLTLVLISPTQANDESFFLIVMTHSVDFKRKVGSGDYVTIDNKKKGFRYVLQTHDKVKDKNTYSLLGVELESCKRGFGYIYENTMEGAYIGKIQFVRFGASIADQLGTEACKDWDSATGKTSLVHDPTAWHKVAETANGEIVFWLNTKTFRKTTYNKKPAVAILLNEYNAPVGKFSYSELVVSQSACRNRFGTYYKLNFDEKVTSKEDIALNGNSEMSAIATYLCDEMK